MRRILFCNIAWMENYKGITDDDIPVNGGRYVDINKDAHEAYNFDNGYIQNYNVIAKEEDCVLLPPKVRSRRTIWWVPRVSKKNGPSYGFGQANVWFANEKNNEAKDKYLKKLIEQIDNYDGENYMFI